IFRGAPSLEESDPQTLGPLVETLAQHVIRDAGLQVHFYRDYEKSSDRRSPIHEVDFVAERADGAVLPVEVKYRKRIDESDLTGLRHFMSQFSSKLGVVVTRERTGASSEVEIGGLLQLPILDFLLAF